LIGFFRFTQLVAIHISIAVAYFIVAQVALTFATIAGNMTLIWPSSGIALALLIRLGTKYAIGIFLGAFAAGVYVGNPHYVSGLIALGNTVEPILAIYLLRFLPFSANLHHIHDYFSLVFAGALGAIASGILGSFAIIFAGFVPSSELATVFIHWWMSDAIGILLLAPFLLLFSFSQPFFSLNRQYFEFTCLIVISLLLALFVLTGFNIEIIKGYKGSYLLMIPVFWSVLRFGQPITALIILEFFIFGVYGMTIHKGIFTGANLLPNLHLFWAYFAVITMGSMIISYINNEKNILYQSINNNNTETYIFCKNDKCFVFVNKVALVNLGIKLTEALKLTPFDLKPMILEKEFHNILNRVFNNEVPAVYFESFQQRKDGSTYPVEVCIQSVALSIKQCYMVTIIDISDKKIAEEKLQLSAKVFSRTHEGIIVTDAKGIIIDVNPAFCNITGYRREEVIGQNPNILSSGKHSPTFYIEMWHSLIDNGSWQGEIWNQNKKGVLYAELLTISSIPDEKGNILQYVGIFSDITQSKKQQETLQQMAHYDVLTQLPNRVLLADRFSHALAHSKRQKNLLAVCFLDLDKFKPVNDLYGHDIGDELLIEVAKRIKTNIRDEDTVSRQGGDEFALLLGDIESFSQCTEMLKRIIEAISKPYIIDNKKITISASIGITLYPTDEPDLDNMMRHADQAMYQAKLAGRNRYHLFNTEQAEQSIQKVVHLDEIKQALTNNEFCLYYQPKVNMATGKVFGAEALIRWNHPEKGLIPPLKFLPIIDGTTLEILLGNWVVNEALKQLNIWNEQGIELEVSVNISSYHLQHTSFVSDLDETMALYPKVDSKHFQLEILESSALGDLKSISSIIKTCIHTLGVNIALDDFGTGYSSLTHLRNLEAQTIKIDQTFVRDMLEDPNDYAIIDSVIGLADAFNRDVIAEGVETSDHGVMLLLMGCNKAQGYGIAKPMPANDIPAWLTIYTPNDEWISYGKKVHNSKESKIKLLKLSLKQWHKHFVDNIQSSPEDIKYWPILKKTKCHCGVLIKRTKQEQIFEEEWLENLNQAHEQMHNIGIVLSDKYLEGNIELARDGLTDIQLAFEKINHVIDRCK